MPLLVRKELVDSGKVKSFKDLKGLKIAEAGEGGSPGSTLNEALKKGGLTYKDVNHVYMGYPQHVPAFSNGAIDASITTEPSTTQAVESGAAVRFSDDKFYPHQQVAVLLYGGDFIKKRPDVAKRFMVAYIKAARYYNDALKGGHFAGPNAKELIDILIADTNVKDPALYAKMIPNGINPDGRVDLASLKRDSRFYVAQGYLEGKAKEAGAESVVDRLVRRRGAEDARPLQAGQWTRRSSLRVTKIALRGLGKSFATRGRRVRRGRRVSTSTSRRAVLRDRRPVAAAARRRCCASSPGSNRRRAGTIEMDAADADQPGQFDGVPGRLDLPVDDGVGERRLRAAHAQARRRRDQRCGRPLSRPHRAHALCRPLSASALGRHAPARRRSRAPSPTIPKSC